jgi:photosystem II stability/assembly factor-like uncharacterized protein
VLTATFRLPGIFGLAAADGAAWVTTGNAVLRIDLRTDRVSQVLSDPGASLTGIAFGAGSLWVEGGMGMLRVDPVTGKVTARIGVGVSVLSFGEGSLWALEHVGDGPLVRIDPATNAVTTFPLPPGKIWDLAAGEGAVWLSVAMPSAGLLRVDPADGRVIARIAGEDLFGQVAVGDGAVWASNGAAVARIDPQTDRVTATVRLLSPLPASGPSPVLNGSGLLAVAPGVVWVTRAGNAGQASVLRIDPRTGGFTEAGLGVGRKPQAVAASGTTVWVVTAVGLARVDLVTCGHSRCAPPTPPTWVPAAPAPVWFYSLQMTSATSGWALVWSANPAVAADNAHILLARTTDGARTWSDVTPAAARPMLATLNSYQALDPVDEDHAYLAVSRATSGDGGPVSTTAVFATADGGRSWTESAVFQTSAPAVRLSFADASHGWLLLGPAFSGPGQPVTWLYQTSDSGLRWSPAATVAPPGNYGTNSFCQPLNLTFLTATTGWVTISCRAQAEFLATQDGGSSWAAAPLPLPAGTLGLRNGPASLTGPQFVGGTGFLTVAPPAPGTPSLLDTPDGGQSWQLLTLPPGAGQYPQVKLFTPADGVLVAAGPQEALGTVFYVTADGGQSWTPVPQGTQFTQVGDAIDFASQQAGFAWNSDNTAGAPPLYATVNSGRTWQLFVPHLVTG